MVLGACGGHVRGNCWACGTHNAARASPLDAAQPLDLGTTVGVPRPFLLSPLYRCPTDVHNSHADGTGDAARAQPHPAARRRTAVGLPLRRWHPQRGHASPHAPQAARDSYHQPIKALTLFVSTLVDARPAIRATTRKPATRMPTAMLIHAMILAAVTMPEPFTQPLEATIAFEALLAKIRATIASTNGHTAHERIASTSATMASEDVCG